MRSVCALPSNPPMSAAQSLSARSPLWPNGGWPRSWLRHAVSTTSGASRRAVASSRPTWATSSECVSRLRAKSARPPGSAPASWRRGAAARGVQHAWPGRARSRCGARCAAREADAQCPRRRSRRDEPLGPSAATVVEFRFGEGRRMPPTSSRESSQPSGSAGRLGVPARPRWPSARRAGVRASTSRACRGARRSRRGSTRREPRPRVAADRVALEVPGDVLADVAAAAVLVLEELDEQLGVAAERLRDEAERSVAPARRRRGTRRARSPNSHGRPRHPRPTTTPSHPVSAIMRTASSADQMSPLPSTGTLVTASLSFAIADQSASPE